MILLVLLLFYLLLVIASAIFFWWKRPNNMGLEDTFVFPFKTSPGFGINKVKVSRFVTRYECPECGFVSEDKFEQCPHCKAQGNKVRMKTRTLLLQH